MISRIGLTLIFGKIGCGSLAPGVERRQAITRNYLHIGFCIDCKAGIFPVLMVSFVFESLPSLVLFIPSPTSSRDSFLSISLVSAWDELKPSIDISEEEAEKISSAVLEGFRAIEGGNCLLDSDIHTGNIVRREGSRSSVIVDSGLVNIREPEYSDEEWRRVVRGVPDTRYIRRLLVDTEDGRWKRTVTPFDMSDWHYDKPLVFNEYVESMPDDFRMATFD
ncbi:hypothetical protein F5146DRAFT_142976 [Armillaria mellea]|nr:hypothetical protein F5146DRAFT_142976 [Armillaria mellea]